MTDRPLPPMCLRPFLASKPWGGDYLARTYGEVWTLADSERRADLGEAWILSTHPNGPSTVGEGSQRLEDVLRANADAYLARPYPERGYPLLVKFLHAREHLSVQVHPNDAQAAAMNTGDRGKSESWFILHAEPGTQLQYGCAPRADAQQFTAAMQGTRPLDALAFHPIRAGMFVPVPPGTVHAIMAGTVLLEIQQSSDTTFRLFDWDRPEKRALHLRDGVACIDWSAQADDRLIQPNGTAPVRLLMRNEFFEVAERHVAQGESLELFPNRTVDGQPRGDARELILIVLSGKGTMRSVATTQRLLPGKAYFVPARHGELYMWAGESLHLILARPLE